jgi:uncharacterized protein YbaR (Trm112 family)
MSFDPQLLKEFLVCTKCHAPLVQRGQTLLCTRADCRYCYAIRDDIPNMVLGDAVVTNEQEWQEKLRAEA